MSRSLSGDRRPVLGIPGWRPMKIGTFCLTVSATLPQSRCEAFPSDSPGHEEEQVGSVEATKSLA